MTYWAIFLIFCILSVWGMWAAVTAFFNVKEWHHELTRENHERIDDE